MKYKFFYDESEHSRRLTEKTINASNFGSHFVVGVIGYKEMDELTIEHGYNVLESTRTAKELKSKTFEFNQLKFGFASLKLDNKKLLDNYFDFFSTFELYNYMAIINKIEYVVIQLFSNYENSIFTDMDVLRYTVAKLLNVYKPEKVLSAMYKNDGSLINELSNFVKTRIEMNEGLEHKEMENRAFSELSILLEDYNNNFSIDWNYYTAFIGLKEYLNEMKIVKYDLILDKEGTRNTINSARKVGLKNVSEKKSNESEGVRIADMFAGIISKLIKAIDIDLDYVSPEDANKYVLLSIEWFELDEESFVLYKKLANIIFNQHQAHYKSFAGNYSDSFIYFLAILGYLQEIGSYEEYMEISKEGHQLRVNNMALSNLQIHSDRMSNKLPIRKIEDDGKDWFLNEKGAKTYRDYKRHSTLNIPKSSRKETGIIYEVLNVGVFGLMEHPSLTILENGEPVCYLLPMELLDWAVLNVGFAMKGTKLFPCKVEFNNIDGHYYADIL